MVQVDNAWELGRELETVVDRNCRGSYEDAPQFQPCYYMSGDSPLIHFYFRFILKSWKLWSSVNDKFLSIVVSGNNCGLQRQV